MTEKCGKKKAEKRHFSELDDLIQIAHQKVTAERGNADKSKQGWGRLLVQAIAVHGNLLKDVELETLARDIEEIKQKIGMKE